MTIITRTSTFASFNQLLGNVNRVQTSLFDSQNQLSSGLKTDSFEGFAGQVEQFVSLEAKIRTVVNYQENNAQNVSRLRTTSETLSALIDRVDDMENLMVNRRNPATGEDLAFGQQMTSLISAMRAELNLTFEGKFLFSGTRTNTPPVPDPVTPPVTTGVPDAGYYQGSQTDITLRADDDVEFAYRVRADNSAFQKAFAAAYESIEADAVDPFDDEMMISAIDLLQEAKDEMIALQATVQSDIVAMENIAQRQNSLELYWAGVTEELSRTDILAVSTKLAVDETVLQASFQAFASINSLRLVNFLN